MLRLFVLLSLTLGLLLPRNSIAQTPLTILHTSEHHGTVMPLEAGKYAGFGGVARRAALIAAVRKEVNNVLMVDSGDLLVGSAMSAVFRGEADIAAMNLMGYDALGLGNHDFDFGLEHLMRLKRQAKFPFLCTNVRPRTANVCQRFVIKSLGAVRILLIGLIGKSNYPDTFNRAALGDLDFHDPIEAARQAIAELREQVEVVVAITHEATEEDLALAHAVPGLDVIIGGHTEGFDGLIAPAQDNPLLGRVELAGAGPIFVKTHRQGRTLGRLDLLYHDRTIMVAEARNLPVDADAGADASVSQLIATYAQRLKEETGRVIGHSTANLDGERETIRTRETNLGNLLADIARRQTGADVALVNSGMVRGSIGSGPVTYRHLMEILPLDSTLSVLTLTGAQLQTALENSVSRLPESNGRFLQVSGLRLLVDPARSPGARITDLQVQGAPLDPRRPYLVAVTRFIADGGDGYSVFLEASNRQDFDVPLRELFAQALKEGPINPGGQPRIVTGLRGR